MPVIKIKYIDLDFEDIHHLAGEYSNYVQEFDYEKSGTPVSIYEFYECEYQEIIGANNEN